jgi:hypothetical protein
MLLVLRAATLPLLLLFHRRGVSGGASSSRACVLARRRSWRRGRGRHWNRATRPYSALTRLPRSTINQRGAVFTFLTLSMARVMSFGVTTRRPLLTHSFAAWQISSNARSRMHSFTVPRTHSGLRGSVHSGTWTGRCWSGKTKSGESAMSAPCSSASVALRAPEN